MFSLKNLNELKEIQGSLNNADQKYIIDCQNGNYVLINRSHKREQITKICDYTNIEKIIKKNKTKHIDYV